MISQQRTAFKAQVMYLLVRFNKKVITRTIKAVSRRLTLIPVVSFKAHLS